MSTWKIGDVTVRRVVERVLHWTGTDLLPEATPEMLARESHWLSPYVDDALRFELSIHSLVIESGGKRLLVDTCIGNHKVRSDFPDWSHSDLPYVQTLADAGCPRESIDLVLCTHLHVDHVGWNTMLDDRGRWVPTFPNAKYLFGGTEWDFFSRQEEDFYKQPVEDSVRPIVADGLADLVDEKRRVTDEVFYEPTPGHTPGHLSIRISSRGEEAVITGDLMHHPVQCKHPEWHNPFDVDGEQAKRTRREFCERHAALGTLVLGTHFSGGTAGRIVRDGDAFRFEAA